MKTILVKAPAPNHSIKLLALAGVMVSLLGAPVAAWSSPTLLYDSYVSTPFVAGVRHGADPALLVNGNNTGFLKFTLANSLPTGVTASDIDKATLKLFINDVNNAGKLTVRQVNQDWLEHSIPFSGVSPTLDLVTPAKIFKIGKAYTRRWVELDVTDIVKGWINLPATNKGIA